MNIDVPAPVNQTIANVLGANNINMNTASSFLHTSQNTTIFSHFSFLNTSRFGAAQRDQGVSLQTFIFSILLSLIIFILQIIIFSLLRPNLKNIYQSNSFYSYDETKITQINQGFFSWILPALFTPLNEYLTFGLDAYFFIRFLYFLLVLFGGLAVVNIPILIPVNYYSGYNSYTEYDLSIHTNGTIPKISRLEKLSMSNIAPKFTDRLSIHLTLAVILVIWFHVAIIIELKNFVKIRNNYLLNNYKLNIKNSKNFNTSNTIFIDNLPKEYLSKKSINELFSKINSNQNYIENIWFVYNYGELENIFNKNDKIVNKIEKLETNLILSRIINNQEFKKHYKISKFNKIIHLASSFQFIKFKYFYKILPINIKFIDKKIEIKNYIQELIKSNEELRQTRKRMKLRENGPLHRDQKYNKVFIQFSNDFHCHILDQLQLSSKLNQLNNTMIYVNPKDIIWSNMYSQSNLLILGRTLFANILDILLVIFWVIPVAFLGLVSRLPYLTALVPMLDFLNKLPEYITDIVSNFLSIIFLMFLSEFVPILFRKFEYLKYKRTGAQIELNLCKWLFSFSFIHLFIIVTISSGLTDILNVIISNPISIPNLVAVNLPKCSNFFYSFILIRCLSYSGNNLLQSYHLCKILIMKTFDYTPRIKFKRLIRQIEYKWGSIYPTFTVLGSIGLIYCIISPLIIIFCLISFLFILFSFKYSIKFLNKIENISENYGKFYPIAIFQLYSGIYFMEICLIGLFAISKNEKNESNCILHSLLTFVLIIFTAIGQVEIQKRFKGLLKNNLPLTTYQPANSNIELNKNKQSNIIENSDNNENNIELSEIVEQKLTIADLPYNDAFFHDSFKHSERILWLPKDKFGISDSRIKFLTTSGIKATNETCVLLPNGSFQLLNSPPDYID